MLSNCCSLSELSSIVLDRLSESPGHQDEASTADAYTVESNQADGHETMGDEDVIEIQSSPSHAHEADPSGARLQNLEIPETPLGPLSHEAEQRVSDIRAQVLQGVGLGVGGDATRRGPVVVATLCSPSSRTIRGYSLNEYKFATPLLDLLPAVVDLDSGPCGPLPHEEYAFVRTRTVAHSHRRPA